MRWMILSVLALSGCGTHKSWQEACFERIGPAEEAGLFAGPQAAPAYDPVLTTRHHEGQRLIYCDK